VDCCDPVDSDTGGGETRGGATQARAGAHLDAEQGSPSHWRRAGTVGSAIAVALLPKCPACWSAYAGLSSLLGLSFVVEERYLLPLTSGLLVLALVPLWLQARRGRGYWPWLLACTAAAATLLGKFVLESDVLLYGGLASLLLASLWSRSARARSPRAAAISLPRTLPSPTAQN